MSVRLKSLKEQVIVITGASSGIGLCTAQMAAERGAAVVLASRNEADLRSIVEQIRNRGGRAAFCVADVADAEAVKKIAETAVREFGGFDTWVNNAGVSIYGKLTEIHLEEKRRLFDVNFWGVVHGCRAAVPHLRQRGGALINIGSVVSERSIPLQGIYTASKHAVKGYTDALRMELEEERAPISVTLIKPASIDTPFVDHARNHLERKPTLPPPVYAPEAVAEAILECAVVPHRDVTVGGSAKLFSLMETYAPGLTDKIMEKTMFSAQMKDEKTNGAGDSLFDIPSHEGQMRGSSEARTAETSLYTNAVLHPIKTAFMTAALLGAVGGAIGYLTSEKSESLH